MHLLDTIFWLFFASVVGFVAFTFLRLLVESFRRERERVLPRPRKQAPPVRSAAAGALGSSESSMSTGGTGGELVSVHGGDSAAADWTSSDSSGSDSGGGDTGGGDFSGGGGESGGGGASGGW